MSAIIDRFRLPNAALLAAFVIVGCSTVRDAWRAQEELEPLGRDDLAVCVTNHIDLSRYSLEELVDFAMTNRPTVASAALGVEDARLALKQIQADAPLLSATPWLSPKLSASGGYAAAGVDGKKLDWKTHGTASGAVTLSIPVYDFGRHSAQVIAQQEKVMEAELDLIDTGYGVFYEVTSSYFQLLERCALLAVARTNEHEFVVHLEQAERRVDAGEATALDVMRARLDLAAAREQLVTAQSEVDTAGAELLKALGVDASYGARKDVIDFPGDPLAFVMQGFPTTDYTVKDAFSLAQTNSPGMRAVRSRLRGASAAVDYAIADLLPEITASASVTWTDPLYCWNWGVSALQSVFQGFRKTTAVDRAVVALRQAAAAVQEEELALSLNIEKSVANRDTAHKALETATVSFREASANLEMVRSQYQVGEVGRVEYTDAVAAYVAAMGSRISAFYQGQCAECAIFALVGIYPVYEEKRLSEEMK